MTVPHDLVLIIVGDSSHPFPVHGGLQRKISLMLNSLMILKFVSVTVLPETQLSVITPQEDCSPWLARTEVFQG